MSGESISKYFRNCGMLLLPAIVWNIAFTKYLPPAYSTDEFTRDLPAWLTNTENWVRAIVFSLPFFMPLGLASPRQNRGVLVFAFGSIVYFASWLPLMLAPQSAWSTSAIGFLAPGYTPLLWLVGLAILGEKLFWGRAYRGWMYLAVSLLFLSAHLTHATIVFTRNY